MTMGLIACTAVASAQYGQPNDDKVQQESPRNTQQQTQKVTPSQAQTQSDRAIEAEKQSKDKGQTQQQTKTQVNGLPPNLTDTINPPKNPDRTIPQKE